jgi:predicted dehydrogenase
MLKIGVLGAGHLGKIHLKCLSELPEIYDLVGFYDPNVENAKSTSESTGLKAFSSIVELIDVVDVLDIVTPTLSHFDCAMQSLDSGKHIFIEKPVTHTLEEADALFSKAQATGLKVQVGHVERFNPAFRSVVNYISEPLFIEAHRLSEFNPRGTDVPVVLDLMIHDIDIVLSTVKSDLINLSASGVNVVSDTPDIANARLEFENGCVANLTASRISMKKMRKSRFFQRDAYITVDFLEKKAELLRMKDAEGEDPYAMELELADGRKKRISFEHPAVHPSNAIRDELESFARSIVENSQPEVTLKDGISALKVASRILTEMDSRSVERT